MSGIGIKTRGSNSSSLFPEARVFILLSSMYLCQRIFGSLVHPDVIRISYDKIQVRMFSGVVSGFFPSVLLVSSVFLCFVDFSEGGISRMDDDSSGLVFQKRC